MPTDFPEITVVKPESDHKVSVIFLHGLGDTADGWKGCMEGDLQFDNVKYILPTAATLPVTLNFGMKMPAWYDIVGLDLNSQEDHTNITKSSEYIHTLIRQEIESGIPSENIILGGFSQGGAIALYAGLTAKMKLGGIIAMSSYLPLRNTLEATGTVSENRDVRILMCHGTADPVVDHSFGQASSRLLRKYSTNVTFKTYPGLMHGACPEELTDIKKFIEERVREVS